jgi:rhamnosyltransferase
MIKESSTVPRVLVILACYNGAPWLQQQLASILSQNGVSIEILIGDDVSKDGTHDVIVSAFGNDARVSLLTWAQGSGSAGANFRRLFVQRDVSTFDYVALADQDDLWLPDKLIKAIEALRKSGAEGYSGAVTAFWSSGEERLLTQNPEIRAADFLFEGAGQGCTFVTSSAFFARVQAFCREFPQQTNELHYHDWLIYLLARAWSIDWYFDQQPLMRYRQHGGNEIGSRGGTAALTRRLQLIRNGWYRTQVLAAVKLYKLASNGVGKIDTLSSLLQARPALTRGLRLIPAVLRDGRRRPADRVVLALAVSLGWL